MSIPAEARDDRPQNCPNCSQNHFSTEAKSVLLTLDCMQGETGKQTLDLDFLSLTERANAIDDDVRVWLLAVLIVLEYPCIYWKFGPDFDRRVLEEVRGFLNAAEWDRLFHIMAAYPAYQQAHSFRSVMASSTGKEQFLPFVEAFAEVWKI